MQRRHGITATSLLNFVVSDGTTLIATRFVSPDTEGPASLYYAEGSNFARSQQPGPHPKDGAPPQQQQQQQSAATGVNGPASGSEAAAAPGQPGGAGCVPCAANTPGSSITQEGSYELGFSAQGPRVVFVASEPITGQTGADGGGRVVGGRALHGAGKRLSGAGRQHTLQDLLPSPPWCSAGVADLAFHAGAPNPSCQT